MSPPLPDAHPSRLLVADEATGLALVRATLGRRAELLHATSLDEALRVVHVGVDGVVCGLHFDESRLLDSLRRLKADPVGRALPFVALRHRDDGFPPAILEGLDIACRALGGAGLVDVVQLERRHPPERVQEQLRRALLGHLELP